MRKEQLARRLAKASRIAPAAAADQVDRIVHDIQQRVRKGQNVSLPGLGTFRPGRERDFQFETDHAAAPARPKTKRESR